VHVSDIAQMALPGASSGMLAELQNPPVESPLAPAQPQLAVVTLPKPKVKHLFTRQTAREAGRKGGKARAEKAAREKAEAEQKAQAPTLEADRYVELRIASVRAQIAKLDLQILKTRDAQKLNWLASAQAKLAEQERILSMRPAPAPLKQGKRAQNRDTVNTLAPVD
jgi:hypothetical protein